MALFATSALVAGCSSSTDSPGGNGTVNFNSEMGDNSVSWILPAGKGIPKIISAKGLRADSLEITSVRMLISNLKMHRTNTTGEEDHVKVGPFMVAFNPNSIQVVASSQVPEGTYDKIKFEMHKLEDKQDSTFINDPNFGEFITGDRYTFIIDGKVWSQGQLNTFEYKSKVTENLELKLDEDVTISSSTPADILLNFIPTVLFKVDGNSPLDPRDPDNRPEIDKAIKDAFKALKKK